MSVPEEELKKYRCAGKIAREVRLEIRKTVKEGMPIIDVCEKVEGMTRQKGGKPAFPCNVSINDVAAHYTSPPGDEQTIPEKAVVKVDIGVHVDGYIADTATTICFDPEYDDMVDTAEQALAHAVEILRPGLSITRFGSEIQKSIKTRGYKPISNLTGHLIRRYIIHAGKSLPNSFNLSTSRIKEGEIYGVEPFVTVTSATARVENIKQECIFRFQKNKSLKNPYAKKMLSYIKQNFLTLPFTERWLTNFASSDSYRSAFSELLKSKAVMGYPVFVEASKKTVAQAEYTILIEKDGCTILT
ncbi:MAG: type II methionyl aminopeptidase [Candidatus Bathyarchaeota archaeon]|nr:type II methionyl aminopeptidase [Candidatus Bathyarchaeum tardum]WGM88659.1 MAG: type II methionyl aminopeptidase [Candidatus Bathyarchaeum tardum]WNZ29083.1 MAG: type II methionyl aminopeptidase [Candidatus Bathyarchaeota archaeon]